MSDGRDDAGSEPQERGPRPSPLAPGLYIVATPIGNLRDVTLRALDILAAADHVVCEDTRITRRLLDRHGLTRSLGAYHDHNAARVRPGLLQRLEAGESVALVSDAGTPLVSDPGYRLVAEAREAGLPVFAAPGPSALLAGLAVAGLPSDRFMFCGFPPPRSGARRRFYAEFAAVPGTLVFYESGPRLAASLADLQAALGDRPAAVARELTKLYEEVVRAPLSELTARYRESGPPRGELVVLVAPPTVREPDQAEIEARLREALREHGVKDAAAEVARATGLPRRKLYALALTLAGR